MNMDNESIETIETEDDFIVEQQKEAIESASRGMQIQTFEDRPIGMQIISTNQVVDRRNGIVGIMQAVMKEGIHFGEPYKGATKNVLLKGGAELLCNVFQLAPEYEVDIVDMENFHREYRIKTSFRHIPSGEYVGEGVGSCSTMESKYRYRNVDEATEVSVPKSAWDYKNDNKYDLMKQELRNALISSGIEISEDANVGFTKDKNGSWVISIKEKGENPDIADVYNTCLKIAKKRSMVDGTITATGCSDLFTQDVDEFEDYHVKPDNQLMTVAQLEQINSMSEYLTAKQAGNIAEMLSKDVSYKKANQVIEMMKFVKRIRYKAYKLATNGSKLAILGEIDDRLNQAKGSADIKAILTELNTNKKD